MKRRKIFVGPGPNGIREGESLNWIATSLRAHRMIELLRVPVAVVARSFVRMGAPDLFNQITRCVAEKGTPGKKRKPSLICSSQTLPPAPSLAEETFTVPLE